jgi:hypothetical protein
MRSLSDNPNATFLISASMGYFVVGTQIAVCITCTCPKYEAAHSLIRTVWACSRHGLVKGPFLGLTLILRTGIPKCV